MKKIFFIISILLTFISTASFANEAKNIVAKMLNNRPANVLLERIDYKGVNPKEGIIKKEHVFVKNNVRYTIDYVKWYDKNTPDELVIYYRANGSNRNDAIGIITVTLNNESVKNYFIYTKDNKDFYIVYGPQYAKLHKLANINHINGSETVYIFMEENQALSEINKHLSIILNAYEV